MHTFVNENNQRMKRNEINSNVTIKMYLNPTTLFTKENLWHRWKGQVSSEYTPVGTKQHKKQENDQWRLLLKYFLSSWGHIYK